MEETWCAVGNVELNRIETRIGACEAQLAAIRTDLEDIRATLNSIDQKLDLDAMRRRNKNIRKRVPFPFMPEISKK